MTTFLDMQSQVNVYTKRPELVSLTDSAIRMATLRAHQVDFFSRDQLNGALAYTVPSSGQPYVDIAGIYTTFPKLRTPDFMQSLDATTLYPSENLEYVVDFKNFWDEWNILRSSVFTLLGSTLRMSSAANTGRLQLYYYGNPDVTTLGYSSWIADLYKEELAMWAAAIVWMRSGFQEIAQQSQVNSIMPFKEMLITSHLSSKI
jgi:hypothetical protein